MTQRLLEGLSPVPENRLAVRDEHSNNREVEGGQQLSTHGCTPAFPDPAVGADAQRAAQQDIAREERALAGQPVGELRRPAGGEGDDPARPFVAGRQRIGDTDASPFELTDGAAGCPDPLRAQLAGRARVVEEGEEYVGGKYVGGTSQSARRLVGVDEDETIVRLQRVRADIGIPLRVERDPGREAGGELLHA